ncbi:MAG: peptide ABC transporter substrate-binding protein [Anaerolineae bacterium]|nr:peptide ABC transporter substrate-binding protein [Anaerolineae bacterium]
MKVLCRLLMLLLVIGLLIAPAAGQDEMLSFSAADCDYGGNLNSVEALDSLTVQITLCNTDALFEQKVASLGLSIHPAEYVNATGGEGDLLTHAIGTGPLKLVNWDQGNEIVFERYDDYWGEPSIEQTVILRWNSEAAARATELRAGTIDGMKFANPDDIPVFRADPNFNLVDIPPLTGVYVAMSNYYEPLNDVRVRRAIAMGIDRQRIVDNFFPPGSPLTSDFAPPAVFGHVGEDGVPGFDQDAAKALLEEAAADLGFELPLDSLVDTRTGESRALTLTWRDVVRGYLPNPGIIANDVQAQLAEIGVIADVQVVESGAFLASANAGNEPLHILGWHADFPDASNFYSCCFGPNNTQLGEPNPALYEPLVSASQVLDPEERMGYFRQVAKAMSEHVPWVPFGHAGAADVWQLRMVGVHPGLLDGTEEFSRIEDPDDDNVIYMQNAEPISLYCNDTWDGETFRACHQVSEALLDFERGGVDVIPGLAETWSVSDDGKTWTFNLRDGVLFHDGSSLDANDVVVSWQASADCASPNHTGTGQAFAIYKSIFQQFINADQC